MTEQDLRKIRELALANGRNYVVLRKLGRRQSTEQSLVRTPFGLCEIEQDTPSGFSYRVPMSKVDKFLAQFEAQNV